MKWGQPFAPKGRIIWVVGRLEGPNGQGHRLHLVLDTGTPVTIIDPAIARRVDLGRDRSIGRARFLGVTGRYAGYQIQAPRLQAFGRTLANFRIACCPFPRELEVDGLLGLDFFENLVVTIDFKQGRIVLEE